MRCVQSRVSLKCWGSPVKKPDRTKIVCLCGSTKFREEFEMANHEESLKGRIVLTVACFGHEFGLDPKGRKKRIFDELHFRKIELADEIRVVNPEYIGLSTCDEIHYAWALGKPVRMGERTLKWEDILALPAPELPKRAEGDPEKQRLVDEREAAEYLGAPVTSLRQWRFRMVGPVYYKLSAKIRYRIIHLDEFLDSDVVEAKRLRRKKEKKMEKKGC